MTCWLKQRQVCNLIQGSLHLGSAKLACSMYMRLPDLRMHTQSEGICSQDLGCGLARLMISQAGRPGCNG